VAGAGVNFGATARDSKGLTADGAFNVTVR